MCLVRMWTVRARFAGSMLRSSLAICRMPVRLRPTTWSTVRLPGHRHTTFVAEHTPQYGRNVEHERLNGQQKWHPLIIMYLPFLTILISIRYEIAERHPVGVLHPTIVLRVLLHGFGELGGHPVCARACVHSPAPCIPAFDRMAHILFGADEYGEDND
jgi:hypothetical protein